MVGWGGVGWVVVFGWGWAVTLVRLMKNISWIEYSSVPRFSVLSDSSIFLFFDF